jgi:CubicO group peptidase (beta-lactamase class C family)
MRRITRIEAFAGAAALALSICSIAHAQQAQPAVPQLTEAEIAASPAARRLKELLEVLNRGDAAALNAYVLANGVDAAKRPPGPAALPLVGQLLDLQRRSRGLDLVRIAMVENNGAIAVVRNRLTGDEQALSIKVEPQAPHRIAGLAGAPPAVTSSLVRTVPAAPTEKAKLQHIGSYLKRLSDADVFSGVVLIARDGKPVFSQAYGYADREKKIPNKVDTAFNIASMGKFMTSLAIGQLVEQGKLSYDDPLSKFVPDYPDAESAKKIKIKHLLSQTSGLGDFLGPAFFNSADKARDVKSYMSVAEKKPLNFEPGAKWGYTNLGYVLLGRVIEVVTGQDYYEYMGKQVFAPAGMKKSWFPHFDRDAVKMAYPYEIDYAGDRLQFVNWQGKPFRRGSPAGDGISSATDILKLDNALRAGRIVKPDTFRLHASPKPELKSPIYGYGYATKARMANRPLVGHGGNLQGACTEYGRLIDTPYTLILLSNNTMNGCMSVVGKILQVLTPTQAPAL